MSISRPEQKAHVVHYLTDYSPPDFFIDTVHLHFELEEAFTKVTSVLHVRRNPAAKTPKASLVLNGQEMQLQSVHLNGKLLDTHKYHVDSERLTIEQVPDSFTLETEVHIKPQENTQLQGLYQSRGNFCTQCEPHGFRHITYYIDRPDVMAQFTTTITGDKTRYPVMLSNGNLVDSRELEGNRHWVRWEDPSLKPCYLFALVAGDFDCLQDQFITRSSRLVMLRLYVEKGYADQASFALEALKHAMRWDEQTFGREYDLDIYMIVAVSDFNMGAMENKGLNIFNTKYILARPETATDQDYVNIESVIGHEYFHNWSGNRITCRDWFQITLKEGLTVFREDWFSGDRIGPAVARINQVNIIRNRQFPEDAGPNAHPIRPCSYVEVNNFYTSTVYEKGAEVIGMIKTLLGKEQFRKAMDLYFTRYDGQAVTTEDFIAAMRDASGRDFTQFCRWYSQSGTPHLEVNGEFDAEKKTFILKVKQSCPPTPGQKQKLPFHLPLAMGLINREGNELSTQLSSESEPQTTTRVLEIKQTSETFTFIHVPERPIPSLLRHFSAPVTIHYPYTHEELAHLLKHDTDIVSRWDAGQMLATHLLKELVIDRQNNQSLIFPPVFQDVFAQLLSGQEQDYHLLVRLLNLPSESYLSQQIIPVPVTEIHEVREWVQEQLALALEEKFLKFYEALHDQKPYQFNVIEMGKRSMKNLCLDYLVTTGKLEFAKLAYQQFSESDNMTDCMAALYALNDWKGEERDQALTAFYNKWQQEPLVVNKWFALQAQSSLPDTLSRVEKLLKHPAFSITNPNSVYMLIVGFTNNMLHFHANDGSGYQFAADQVLAIDPHNAVVSARVVEPLTRWQPFDQSRQQLMQAQLQRILKAPSLSKNVYELISKSLSLV